MGRQEKVELLPGGVGVGEWSSVDISKLTDDFRLDAEYYRPEYLAQERATGKRPSQPLVDIASISDGNHLTIAEEFRESGVRYLRGQDLSDFFISDSDPIFIPEQTYKSLARSHMFRDDILLGIVGTIGNVGLVTDKYDKLTGNCKLAIIRCHTLPSEFVAAYLASSIGQNEIQRRIRGAVQMGLILPDLKRIPIVSPTDAERDFVVDCVRDARKKREQSRKLVADAEQLIEDSTGVASLDLAPTLTYDRTFQDLRDSHRFGAEYFMPCKQLVIEALQANATGTIGTYCDNVRELFDPASVPHAFVVRNFDLTDALDPILDNRAPTSHSEDVGSTKKRFRANDVVISRLRSYLRQIAIVRTNGSIQSVGSTEFIVLRPHARSSRRFTPETLLVFLRSRAVQTVLKWSQDGSQHPRFSDEELLNIPVPRAVWDVSKRVDALVNEALDLRLRSFSKLEDAKEYVDRMIRDKR